MYILTNIKVFVVAARTIKTRHADITFEGLIVNFLALEAEKSLNTSEVINEQPNRP